VFDKSKDFNNIVCTFTNYNLSFVNNNLEQNQTLIFHICVTPRLVQICVLTEVQKYAGIKLTEVQKYAGIKLQDVCQYVDKKTPKNKVKQIYFFSTLGNRINHNV
jgi:nucleoside permease NupC